MKYLRKAICVWMILCLLLGLAACSRNNNVSGNEDTHDRTETDQTEKSENSDGQSSSISGSPYTDEYSKTALFHFGMVPAKANGSWGYVNQNGDWAIDPQYERAYPFSQNGLAFVKTGDSEYRLINRDGEFASDIVVHDIYKTGGESTVFTDTNVKWVVMRDDDGELRTKLLVWDNGEIKVLPWDDANGTLYNFSDSGYAIVETGSNSYGGTMFGIVDSNLQFIFEPVENYTLDYMTIYGGDHLVVYDHTDETSKVIDVHGNVLSTVEGIQGREKLYFNDNGIAVVEGIGIVDETGNVICPADKCIRNNMSLDRDFRFSDWFISRSSAYMEYWSEQGEMMLGCSNGEPVKNGMLLAYLLVRTDENGKPIDVERIKLDENGERVSDGKKVVWNGGKGFSIEGNEEQESEWVVLNDKLEVMYFLSEKDIAGVGAYHSDGYAVATSGMSYDDNKTEFVVDRNGNSLFAPDKDPDRVITSIYTDEDNQ